MIPLKHCIRAWKMVWGKGLKNNILIFFYQWETFLPLTFFSLPLWALELEHWNIYWRWWQKYDSKWMFFIKWEMSLSLKGFLLCIFFCNNTQLRECFLTMVLHFQITVLEFSSNSAVNHLELMIIHTIMAALKNPRLPMPQNSPIEIPDNNTTIHVY